VGACVAAFVGGVGAVGAAVAVGAAPAAAIASAHLLGQMPLKLTLTRQLAQLGQ
jgi:hypothetical protein